MLRQRFVRLVISGALLVGLAGFARASEPDLRALPVQGSWGCTACHSAAGTTPDFVPAAGATDLTEFGRDWLRFGRVWGPDLAAANSDGDSCSNGYELSDPDGGWTPEQPYLSPSDAHEMDPSRAGDCLIPIGDQSWGVLKTLFGED